MLPPARGVTILSDWTYAYGSAGTLHVAILRSEPTPNSGAASVPEPETLFVLPDCVAGALWLRCRQNNRLDDSTCRGSAKQRQSSPPRRRERGCEAAARGHCQASRPLKKGLYYRHHVRITEVLSKLPTGWGGRACVPPKRRTERGRATIRRLAGHHPKGTDRRLFLLESSRGARSRGELKT